MSKQNAKTPQPPCDTWFEYAMVHYRWVFVCLFLLPLSCLYDLFYYIRSRIVFKLSSAPRMHEEKVKRVQKQVRQWNTDGRTKFMCTSRPGWMTMSFRVPKYKKTYQNIDVNLVDVLEINPNRHTVRVEPLVTMGQLSATLIPEGWTCAIVPELDDLTVGGLIMGAGIETSSHKYGLFQHICVSLDVVMPDGELEKCSPTENPDLFYALPWSHGTLGFLVAAELTIVPAKPYVELTYIPTTSLDETIAKFKEEVENPANDFVEGLVYSIDTGVIMRGKFADESTARRGEINEIGNYYKPWFYKHAEDVLSNPTAHVTEYIPLRDYYHRHTKGIFWEMKDIIPFGNSVWFRYLFGWMSPPKVSFLKQTQTAAVKKMYENHHVLQDMLIPQADLKEALIKFDEAVEIYPLWLCPFTLFNHPGMVHPAAGNKPEPFVDLGAYGVPLTADFEPRKTHRALEGFVRRINGYQMMYADTYMTREEFRQMFDHRLYDDQRRLYDCQHAFPEVYDKVSRAARH